MYYVFECGCELDHHPGYFSRRSKKTGLPQKYIKTCPDHGQQIKYKKIKCKECGEWFTVDYKTNHRIYCDKCKRLSYTAKYKAKRALANRKGKGVKYKKRENDLRFFKRKSDCVHYTSCLMVGGRLIKSSKACEGCSDYKPRSFENLIAEMQQQGTGGETHERCE